MIPPSHDGVGRRLTNTLTLFEVARIARKELVQSLLDCFNGVTELLLAVLFFVLLVDSLHEP